MKLMDDSLTELYDAGSDLRRTKPTRDPTRKRSCDSISSTDATS